MIASLWRKFAVPTFPSSLIFIVNRNQRVCAIFWRKNWSMVGGTQFYWAWLNCCTDDLRQDVEMVWVHRARTFLSSCAIFRATCLLWAAVNLLQLVFFLHIADTFVICFCHYPQDPGTLHVDTWLYSDGWCKFDHIVCKYHENYAKLGNYHLHCCCHTDWRHVKVFIFSLGCTSQFCITSITTPVV